MLYLSLAGIWLAASSTVFSPDLFHCTANQFALHYRNLISLRSSSAVQLCCLFQTLTHPLPLMVDLPYIAGQLNGCSFQAQVTGLGNNMAQPYSNNAYTQPSPTSQLTYSPLIGSRHDSLYSLSPSQPSRYLQHKAESQPDATHLTPHFNNAANAHRSEDMSRETSHASYQSSVSSGMQYDGIHNAHGYHHNIPPVGSNTQRALSLHSGVANLQNQLFRAQPIQNRSLNEYNHGPPNSYHSALANMAQNSPHNATMDDSVTDYQTNDAVDARFLGYDFSSFGPG